MPSDDAMLSTLVALAEALIPVEATVEWAGAFLRARMAAHPAEGETWLALAAHVEALAGDVGVDSFARLPVAAREKLVRARHATLAETPETSADDRVLRRAMRNIIVAFFTADDFDFASDPYALAAKPRDRDAPTTPEYSTADRIPDAALDRRAATSVGIGTYARAWRAAGYPRPPGLAPEHPDEVSRAPDELVPLRKR